MKAKFSLFGQEGGKGSAIARQSPWSTEWVNITYTQMESKQAQTTAPSVVALSHLDGDAHQIGGKIKS